MNHFCHLDQKAVAGFGRRWFVTCRPCKWQGPFRTDKADANEDFRRHAEATS